MTGKQTWLSLRVNRGYKKLIAATIKPSKIGVGVSWSNTRERKFWNFHPFFCCWKFTHQRIRQWDKLYRTSRIVCHQDATSMQVHVHDHSLSSCLYFHFQSRCLAAFSAALASGKRGQPAKRDRRERRLPEAWGANTQGLCVTLQLRFVTIVAKPNFRSQPLDHTRAAPSYVMAPASWLHPQA